MTDGKPRGLAVPNPDRRQCTAHSSRTGKRCKKPPIRGATVCATHGGSAPSVRKKAAERLAAHADILMAQLLKIAMSGESEPVRLAAIKDALDRAGFGAAQVHKLALAQPWDDFLADIITDEAMFEPATPQLRALPATEGGGDDDDEDYAAASHRYVTPDRPARPDAERDADGSTYNTPETIRGEVVQSVTRVHRSRRALDPPAHIRDGLGLGNDPDRGATFAP